MTHGEFIATAYELAALIVWGCCLCLILGFFLVMR